jgi:hypothetical protein
MPDFEYLMPLVDFGACTLVLSCIDFRLGCQPVSHGVPAIEAAMFGMKIGGNGNLILMLLLMLGRLAFNGRLFMLSFCSVYGMRHDVPPLKIG